MARLGSRIRHFRAPVVITVALGAMPGCGGKAGGDAEGNTKQLTTCPADPPAEGAVCDYRGPACEYQGCGAKTATCRDGAWRVYEMSCNPPPPNRCPEQVPEHGAPCDYQGPACDYGDCYGNPTHRATCAGNTWNIAQATCNPPAPEWTDAGGGG
jgi:hypothetical protein